MLLCVWCCFSSCHLNPSCFPQCGALRFTDSETSCVTGWVSGWVAVFSPNDISGLRRPKNDKFGTKVASSTGMMRALIFFEKVFLIVAKFAKTVKNRPKCQTVLSTEDPMT